MTECLKNALGGILIINGSPDVEFFQILWVNYQIVQILLFTGQTNVTKVIMIMIFVCLGLVYFNEKVQF